MHNITREQCEEFRANPTRNPLTRRPIDPTKATALSLRQICDERNPLVQRRQRTQRTQNDTNESISRTQCDEFRANPGRNPKTGKRIDPEKQVARKLRNDCDRLHPIQQPRPVQVPNERIEIERARNTSEEIMIRFGDQNVSLQRLRIDLYNIGRYFGPRSVEQIDSAIHPLPLTTQTLIFDYKQLLYRMLGNEYAVPIYVLGWHNLPLNERTFITPRVVNHISVPDARSFINRINQHYGIDEPSPDVNVIRKVYSPSDVDFNTLPASCVTLFTNVSPEFKNVTNIFRKMCKDMYATCTTSNLSTIRRNIHIIGETTAVVVEISQEAVAAKKVLQEMFNIIKNRPSLKNVWRASDINRLLIHVQGAQGVGSGVTRSVLTMLADEIANIGLFIPAEEGGIRRIINPRCMNVKFIKDLGFRVTNVDDIKRVFTMIGEVITLCVRNDIPINIAFSHAILARMIFKETEISLDEDTFYYFIDMPKTSRPELLLLSSADDIEYTGLEMNTKFNLVTEDKNADLTKHNYHKYLNLVARHQLVHRHTRESPDTYELLQALVRGVYIKNKLRANNATVNLLDKMIGGVPIDEDSLRAWVALNLMKCTTNNKALKWMHEIMLDMGQKFPFSEINKDPKGLTPNERKETFLQFIRRLMHFWTGVRRFDATKEHQIVILNTGGLPKSSTCFYQLKLPNNLASRQDLYTRLVKAVYNVEDIVGLYGGKCK